MLIAPTGFTPRWAAVQDGRQAPQLRPEPKVYGKFVTAVGGATRARSGRTAPAAARQALVALERARPDGLIAPQASKGVDDLAQIYRNLVYSGLRP